MKVSANRALLMRDENVVDCGLAIIALNGERSTKIGGRPEPASANLLTVI
jgi:hypothetical protein